jgi:hypothetical protein
VGLLVRPSPRPVEVHTCHIRRCQISANGDAQVDITSDAHDLLFEDNRIDGEGQGIGIRVAATASSIGLVDNQISQCEHDVQIKNEASIGAPPQVSTCGYADAPASAFLHLSVPDLSPT